MRVQSLNIGRPRLENFFGKECTTSICKQPVATPLALGREGFAGDGVADRKHHGGADKAVCAYSFDHYPHWQEVLGITLPAAAFGENLAIAGLVEEGLCIGDSFRIGTAVLQVSQPRQPCRTLAARYGRADFVKVVVDSGRTGWYFRVLAEGEVGPGDTLTLLAEDPARLSVAEANRVHYHDRRNRVALERVLSVAALSAAWRETFESLLANCDRPEA